MFKTGLMPLEIFGFEHIVLQEAQVAADTTGF